MKIFVTVFSMYILCGYSYCQHQTMKQTMIPMVSMHSGGKLGVITML